ncbi:hypothetical protein USB125703_01337 [Pseudoclavibacter triregionum]|nr:hypothetical protein USB125703_01337 [Pseudoclavibacter triregionum]
MSERPDLDDLLERYQVNESFMIDLFGEQVTFTESTWLAERVFDRDTFEGLKDDALEFGSQYPGVHMGHGDAMRHAYWNALMTQQYGEDSTKRFTTAHEMKPGNNAQEEAMDLYNNEVGRRIAGEHPDATPEELQTLVEQASANGELLVVDSNGELAWSDQVEQGSTSETGHSADGPIDGQYPGMVGEEPYGE